MARRLDSESEKMANFLRLERRIISRERLRATSSAVKMLAWLLMRKLFETSRPTAAAEPSVYRCCRLDYMKDIRPVISPAPAPTTHKSQLLETRPNQELLQKRMAKPRIIIGSDQRTKQGIEGKIVGFRSGRVRIRDKDHRSEPDRRSEAINFGAC